MAIKTTTDNSQLCGIESCFIDKTYLFEKMEQQALCARFLADADAGKERGEIAGINVSREDLVNMYYSATDVIYDEINDYNFFAEMEGMPLLKIVPNEKEMASLNGETIYIIHEIIIDESASCVMPVVA